MRLTLRTLLAYLDDTLEPAQAKLIGQKVAESEQARDLIERIQQVTHRRRITTPATGGPGGKIDPNTVGEYLDNVITPEQASEVEEIALASDVHLAEVAACHQILTLILGEPALVPPSSRQRMYGLVKGPEAIPFRKPPNTGSKGDIDLHESHDVDHTLRLGIPPVSGRNKGSPWILVGGGALAACLLAVAIWQILQGPVEPTPNNAQVPIAHVDPNKDKAAPIEDKKENPEVKKEIKEDKKEEKKEPTKDPREVKLPPVVFETPGGPPSPDVKQLGKIVIDLKDPPILLQFVGDKMEWRRIGPKNPEVNSGRPLVSLPAANSVVQLSKGLKLTLVGSMFPELFYSFPLFESSVELHSHDQLDLDLTLRRGRIRIATQDGPARVRVRFENPTQPNQNEWFDLALQEAGTEVLIDRWFFMLNEKFYKNAKDPNRLGPSAHMACVVLSGSLVLKANDVTLSLAAPPGKALVAWNSLKGLDKPLAMEKLPDGLRSYQPLPPGIEPKRRNDLLRARDDLHRDLLGKAVDVVLAEGVKAPDLVKRRLTGSSLGAVDDVSTLLELLEQEQTPELRTIAIEVLRNWIAAGRDHDYKLYDLLKTKYRGIEAESMMTLLHGFSERELGLPDTYDLLISYLTHPQLPIRELAAWNLYQIAPAGQKIAYSASADAVTRMQAQKAWRALIPPNQLPPAPMKK